MTGDETVKSIDDALMDLVADSRQLAQLEARLGRFNLFRVLRAERNELRHSNVLAWLLQPNESHGLGDIFLRRWLIRVMHGAYASPPVPPDWVSPIKVDTLSIDHVEVHRELANIDVLVEIHRTQGQPWIVCIENKVEAAQHSSQLKRYRETISRRYDTAERRIYIFLTKHGDSPDDDEFIPTTYDAIAEVLGECIEEKGKSIAPDPLQLLRHYRELLTDDFMTENETTQLARDIYVRHKRALDFIFENKIDVLRQASDALYERLVAGSKDLRIVPDVLGKGYVRFVPTEWDVPANRGGSGWGANSRFLLCEVCLWTKKVELQITAGHAPDAWADELWSLAASPPFKREWKKRPTSYIKPFKAPSDIPVHELGELNREDMGAKLFEWLKAELEKPHFKDAVQKLAVLLSKLKQP